MAINKEELVEAISNMTVLEVVDLVETLEEKFGVSAAMAAAPAAAAPAAASAESEEQTSFEVVMSSFGDNKIGVIKVARGITGLGLKEAKNLVEAIPASIKKDVNKEEADEIAKQLQEAGATVEIK
ncbi:MAG: 50S ribosomal protein L7/L12 [Candidatus Porifericomitaceae bacterium WSBS_2022_MAG_OTU9]